MIRATLLLLLLTLASIRAEADIAFVNAADLGNNNGTTASLTAAYTVTAGSSVLYVVFLGDLINGANDITGVTYGGMTGALQFSDTSGNTNNNENRIRYIYAVFSPPSGSNNVVISATSSHWLLAGVAEYSGTVTHGPPDSTVSQTNGGTTVTAVTTTVATNAWALGFGEAEGTGGAWTAGTGATLRAHDGAFNSWAIFDSNGPITPGAYSMTGIVPGPALGDVTLDVVSFAPFVSSLMLRGCCN